MVIKKVFVQFIFLLLLSAFMFAFLNQILLEDTKILKEIETPKSKATLERFLNTQNVKILPQGCNISSPVLIGKMDIDKSSKNWSTIENINPV